jgi:hypothetical protein
LRARNRIACAIVRILPLKAAARKITTSHCDPVLSYW